VLNKIVTATFSVPMNPLTITASTFTVKQGTTPVVGTVTYTGLTASFTPAVPFTANTVYTGTIMTGANNLTGIPLATDYVWSFTTGIPPTVTVTDPANAAINVVLNKIVTATFSVPMNPLTITASTFTVKQGTTPVVGTVTYTGLTASFTPAVPFTANTVYTGTIMTGANNLTGIPLATDYVWSFTTGIPPTVTVTDPANAAINVVLNKIVTATFSVPMNPLTITASTFTVKQGTTPVIGTVTYTGSTASFTPAVPFAANTVYTGTIMTGANNLTGIPLATDYVWTFSTGTSPTVISTDPLNNAIGISLTKAVAATFSVPMDPLTFSTTTFNLKMGTSAIAGAVTYSGSTAVFTPTIGFIPNTVYTATITTAVKNVAGLPLVSDYVWSFTTGIAPTVTLTDPINNATGVILTKTVTANFSVAMDPLTLTGTTFTLKQGTTPVVGAVTYSGTTASFNPTMTALLPNTVYTATITTGAKNIAGIGLAIDHVWSFTTEALVPPTVILTDPLDNAINVITGKTVTANFDMAMDRLSITGTTFTLKQGTTPVAGAVSYAGITASFNPTVDLLPGLVYTATITTGVKSLAGASLAVNKVWSFTTIPAASPKIILTDPIDKSTGVAVNKTIGATFDMPMDPATLISPATTFTLMQGTTVIAGAVTYSSANAYFKPSVDLLFGTTYTAKVTTAAKNVSGTPIARDSVWTFTTVAEIKPLFSSIFGSFGGNAGITNQGIYTVINNGSIGTTAASTLITGFHDSTGDIYTETPLNIGNVKGRIYTDAPPPVIFAAGGPYGGNAATMAIAQAGLLAASNFYISISPANKPGGITLDNDELGGRTLAPGIYKSGSSYNITSIDLTLDAQGDPNAEWIFQVPSALTVGVPSGARSIILTGGAQAKNVYWYVGTAAVINYAGGGTMVGTIIANSGVTLSSPGNSTNTTVQTVLNGRAISLVSAVTMVNTIINVPQ